MQPIVVSHVVEPPVLVIIANKVNHVFSVFGLVRYKYSSLSIKNVAWLNAYPENPEIIVSDPWVNIVCRLAEYPGKFIAQMTQWNQEGKNKS